ncbi:MAG TPA: hypothetical protein VIO94_06850 [Phenylobacterium sp.]
MLRTAAALAALALLASCSKPDTTPYNVNVPLKEIMGHVIDPAAFMIWHASGWEITEAGERDLSPTTAEGWATVENGATILAESGNLLMLPDRALDDKEWMQFAARLTKEAMAAKAAAEAKDKQGLFDTGARIYQVCTDCHQKYVAK